MLKNILIILSALLIVFSCTEKNENYFLSNDIDYYPLESGKYNIYQVQEINIDVPSNVYDTLNYQLKEMIGGVYTDNSGETVYMLLRYKRDDENASWNISDVWNVIYEDNRLIVNEENLKFVKMNFPFEKVKSWDGNAYNTNESMLYEVKKYNEPAIVNSHSFDSVLTVYHENDSSLISKDIEYEIYARDTGLIYKEKTHLNSQEVIPDVPLEERLETGSIYIQKFIESGREDDYEI